MHRLGQRVCFSDSGVRCSPGWITHTPFNPQAKAMKSLFFLFGSLPQRQEYKTDARRR